jgi:cytochrome c oxidase assembly protein subunit 15
MPKMPPLLSRNYDQPAMRRVAGVALALLYGIVLTGVTVRLTGSGLGCPDWPSCDGARPVPEIELHGLIEFANRVMSLPTLLATLLAVWAAHHLVDATGTLLRRRDLLVGVWATLAAVAGNVVLGGLTIRLELDPRIVSLHFLISMLSLAAMTWTWHAATRPAGWFAASRRTPAARWFAAAIALSSLAVITAGVMTTASGPHSGGTSQQVIERLGGGSTAVTLHARGAYVFAAFVLIAMLRWRRSRAGAREITLLSVLVVSQIMLGEWQYRTGLPWQIVLAHVANAAAIWIVTCMVALRIVDPVEQSAVPQVLAHHEEATT